MKKLCCGCVFLACMFWVTHLSLAQDLFPAADATGLPLETPPDAHVELDEHGNLTIEGRARYFVGTQFVGAMRHDFKMMPWDDPKYDWIYGGPVNYNYARRLGFDSVGFFMQPGWIRSHDPNLILPMCFPADENYQLQVMSEMRLPLYVDFTCAPWSNGLLVKSERIHPAAINTAGHSSQGNHWVPYSIITPEGRALYRDMWAYGAKQIVQMRGNPLFYELFNEPAYSEVSPANRKAFLNAIRSDFSSIDQLNQTWGSKYTSFEQVIAFRDPTDHPGLFVQWSKFLEDAFTSLCAEGVKTIKQIDTRDSILFTVQTLGGNYARVVPSTHVNVYDIGQIVNAIQLPTSGGLRSLTHLTQAPAEVAQASNIPQGLAEGILQRHMFRALANQGNKPVFNGEAYGYQAKGIRNMYWLDLMRGCNAGYLFSWNKRAWDKLWKQPEGGKKLAEKFPYMMLNNVANTPQSLAGPMDFKKELATVNDLVVPRQNRPASRVALLFSYPTERFSQVSGSSAHHLIRQYAAALELSHFAIDLLFEEQLANGDLSKYDAIIAAGTQNTYPQTPSYLTEFVRGGGTVILGQQIMAQTEYGLDQQWEPVADLQLRQPTQHAAGALDLTFKQSALIPGELKAKLQYAVHASDAWQTLATLHQQPALLRKTFGDGQVYYLAAHMPDYALASLLTGVLGQEDLKAQCELSRVDDGQLATNVEVHLRKSGDLTVCFLFNHDAYPKLMHLDIPGLTAENHVLIDPISGMRLPMDQHKATVLIKPEDRLVLVYGPESQIQSQFGKTQLADIDVLKQLYAQSQIKAPEDKDETTFKFEIDDSKAVPVNLKPYVNRGFVDKVANDGKGGWTDQGENSLQGVPWGLQNFLGVPFELIRFDENFNKTCIVLQSTRMSHVPLRIDGVKVNMQAKAMYFLTTTAWTAKGTEAMRFVIHYEDGSQATVPVVCGQQTHDWWVKRAIDPALPGKLAWKNSQKRGLFAFRWQNPHPDRTIDRLDVVSANNQPIPIVVAITVEQP